jgi:hypothetical protein
MNIAQLLGLFGVAPDVEVVNSEAARAGRPRARASAGLRSVSAFAVQLKVWLALAR